MSDIDDEVARAQAIQSIVSTTIASLGEEKSKPFELDVYFEKIVFDYEEDQLCPRVRLVKR